jgi:rRNA biogenesis protein RRP5
LEDFQKLYDEGDKVRAYVLKVDREKKRVSLSLKPSYFENDDEEMPDVEQEESSNEVGDIIETDTEAPDDQMQIDSFVPTPIESQAEPLAVEAFNWTGETVLDADEDASAKSESESDLDKDDEAPKRKKDKRSKIKFDKTLSLPLASAADYERVILSKPDSSQLWTQYMAHLLQLGEVDKARTVADRALKTINMREEGEKTNMWVAFLNMENSFGTDETLDEAFGRACEYTDKKKMHAHLASILIKSGKDEKADEVFQTMLKKFSQSSKVWVNYASYLLEHGREEDARELLQRSLRILPKRKRSCQLLHAPLTSDVKTVSKFAQLEFKSGSPEHGRTIMTGLLANYPRRFDLWSIFLDLEIRQQDVAVVRYTSHLPITSDRLGCCFSVYSL